MVGTGGGGAVAVGVGDGVIVGTGSGVAVSAGMDVMVGRGVGDIVGVGVAVAAGTGVDGVAGGGVVVDVDRVDVLSCTRAACPCVDVDGVMRRGGTVGVAAMGAANSRRGPHPQTTSKAMLAPSVSNPCRVSHPGVPRTVYPGAERLKEQRPGLECCLKVVGLHASLRLRSHGKPRRLRSEDTTANTLP
jgi:hypothetical protein